MIFHLTNLEPLSDLLSSIRTVAQVRPDLADFSKDLLTRIDEIFADIFGLLIILLTEESLSLHQRLAILYLASTSPKPASGVEIARAVGKSVVSKSIYRDIENLEEKGFVVRDQLHPRMFTIRINQDHRLMKRLLELTSYYGGDLRTMISFGKESLPDVTK